MSNTTTYENDAMNRLIRETAPNGGVSVSEGNQAVASSGKTEAAQRTIPLVKPLEDALRRHHGLLCAKQNGELMSETAFQNRFNSYLYFLETQVNGCHKRWYAGRMDCLNAADRCRVNCQMVAGLVVGKFDTANPGSLVLSGFQVDLFSIDNQSNQEREEKRKQIIRADKATTQ